MNMIIEASGLSFWYDLQGPPALQDVSLQVPKGSALALLGPNGAGKTTLLDLILGWKSAQRGTITVDAKIPSELRRKEAGKLMSLVAQSEHISFSFSVIEYVLFGRTPHLHQLSSPSPADRDIAREALSQVRIEHLSSREITRLSGGELQLVKLARSIAQRSEIILLDEPTSDLDPGNTDRVMNIMEHQKQLGLTQVFTTHDPMIASDIATHAALIRGGRLQHFGVPEDVLDTLHLSRLYGTTMSVHRISGRRVIVREHAKH